MNKVNDWAEKLLAVFPERNRRADLDHYLMEVNNDQAEQMYYTRELDEETECKPTYEQLSLDRIINEANRNISALKALETVLNDRMQGLSSLHSYVNRISSAMDFYDGMDGSLRIAIDSFYLFAEQEISQSKQQTFLTDLRKSVQEIRSSAQKRLSDYLKEIGNAEKDVNNAEKKLNKTKETAEKEKEKELKKSIYEFDSSYIFGSGRNQHQSTLREKTGHHSFTGGNTVPGFHSTSNTGNSPKENLSDSESMKNERDIKEDIRALLKTIANRDQILKATRRALQKLDLECRNAIFFTLRKMMDKEKECLETRKMVLQKFESSILKVSVEQDIQDFITNHASDSEGLVLKAQALSLLGDLTPQSQASSTQLLSRETSTGSQNSDSNATNTTNAASNNNGVSLNVVNGGNNVKTRPLSMYQPGGPVGNGISNLVNNNGNTNNGATTINNPATRMSLPLTPSSALSASHHHESNAIMTSPTPPEKPLKVKNRASHHIPVPPQWEFTGYLSQIFYTQAETIPLEMEEDQINQIYNASIHPNDIMHYLQTNHQPITISTSTSIKPVQVTAGKGVTDEEEVKNAHRKARIAINSDLRYQDVESVTQLQLVRLESNKNLLEATQWLCNAVKTNGGRAAFISELNQFRSRKVDLGGGFDALGIVIWAALSYCQLENDIHKAKVLMMLSQTFYRKNPITEALRLKQKAISTSNSGSPGRESIAVVDGNNSNAKSSTDEDEDDDEEVERVGRRGAQYRQYLKDKLVGHPIWEDGNFWEQTLWQCAIEQLQTIPYEKPWHDMDNDFRNESIRRVHDVLFSQVMAVTHSMMEVGCSKEQCREFLYRMCVIHELSESQRQQLLAHVFRKK